MSARIRYAELNTTEEFELATDVEIGVWGLSPRDAVPPNLFRAATHNGGVLIGAYLDEVLVGIAFALAAHRDEHPILWSHMAGVLPQYQGQGIGEGLKYAQRSWAISRGIHEIRWTFDPLQRGNANFNLARLGAIADTYFINHYGTMTDSINAGMPSDRIEACWRLLESPFSASEGFIASLPYALTHDDESRPVIRSIGEQEFTLAEIPADLRTLRIENPTLLLEWRMALRQVLSEAFALGYIAATFVRISQTRCEAYLLKRLLTPDSSL
ncbi:MAG: GNAT family N-acetyltransferase [Anaerolineae bacterium]|nr:GNAT family N-acetyltransferase [Anaerolineae bacterium]NUQ02511.1 GNAT family N-acetyltransferase [Anaerolineae bacterium]